MYQELSKHYDIFMRDVDYSAWLSYVAGFLPKSGSGADLGCGTGKFTIGLKKMGYDVYGVDISPGMLSEAYLSAKREGLNIRFIEQDISGFVFDKKLDFVTAMCDTVNYVEKPSKVFGNVYSTLGPGGVFVFDISSEYKLKEILAGHTYSDSYSDITYIWNNYLNKKGDALELELTFFKKEGALYKKTVERQTQYIYGENEIVEMLELAGFKNIKAYGGMTRTKPKENSERIHFVAYK